MLLWAKPEREVVQALIEEQGGKELTYEPQLVGLTRGRQHREDLQQALPPDQHYDVDHTRVVLGHGFQCYQNAKQVLAITNPCLLNLNINIGNAGIVELEDV